MVGGGLAGGGEVNYELSRGDVQRTANGFARLVRLKILFLKCYKMHSRSKSNLLGFTIL